MQCQEFRQIVDAYLADELLVETNHEILRHLEGCPECRQELLARRGLRRSLQTAFNNAGELALQPDFAERLTRHLHARADRVPAMRRRRLVAIWALAASLVLAAGVMLFRASARAPALSGLDAALGRITEAIRAAGRDAAADHLDCALHHRLEEPPISLEEAGELWDPAYRAIDEAVEPALGELSGEVLEMVGAHGCVLAGRRFAHVVLSYRGRLVSILVAEQAGQPSAGSAPPEVTALPVQDGFHLAFFQAPRHVVFVVSELDEADVMAVARSVSAPVYRHLMGA